MSSFYFTLTPNIIMTSSQLLSLPLFGKMAALLALTAAGAQGQTLISHYSLDNTLEDSGTLGIDGELINQASFVTGGAGSFDYALSTLDGTQDFFRADTSSNTAFNLDAITISMWVNVSAFADTDRLVSSVTGSNGFDLYLKTGALTDGDYRLSFGFNSTSGAEQSADNAGYQLDEWVFLAVTYDSTIVSGDNVFFYLGNEANSVVMNDSGAKSGSIVTSTSDLEIGGTPATSSDRTPTALFNDVRIYNGALDVTALESLRVAAIPEPAHCGIMLGALLMTIVVVKRRI